MHFFITKYVSTCAFVSFHQILWRNIMWNASGIVVFCEFLLILH